MVKVNGKPILEHLVNQLNKAGITEIIVNVHSHYDKIFRYFGTRLLYLYEPTLLGEAGTEKVLQNWLEDEYIVMNGDTLTNLSITEMIKFLPNSVLFWNYDGRRYAGTRLMGKYARGTPLEWGGEGAYYFDCGTPAKLAKARRYYKYHR